MRVPTGDVYWLKPVPVKVIVCAGVPGATAAAADRLDAVMVGAIAEASPMPIALVAKYVAPLPGDALVTVRLHWKGVVLAVVAAPAVTLRVSVIVVALGVAVPRETPVQLEPERASVALEEKPLPVTEIGALTIAVPVVTPSADGVTSLISLPVIVKTEPEVTEPPSGFVTVTV
jgi:hypothetical protein